MSDRHRTREMSGPAEIQPRAAPVDAYVRPPEPAPSPLHELAQGLGALSDGLSGWMAGRQKERDEADRIRGVAAFHKNNQQGWAEAVRQGLVPANSSPVFMEAYKNTEGNLLGVRARERFLQDYSLWSGRNSDDPAEFDRWFSQWSSANVSTDDPEVLRGLLPHLERLSEDAYGRWSEERAARTYKGAVDTNTALAGNTIDWASQTGILDEKGTDYDLLLVDILSQRDAALASGIRKEDFDKGLVDTIVDKAVEHGDPALLDMLDQVFPGEDVALSALPEFRDRKAWGIAQLEQEAVRRADARDRAQEKADRAMKDRLYVEIVRVLSADPTADVPEELVVRLEALDPKARQDIAGLRRTFTEASTSEDPQDLMAMEWLIQQGATPEDIRAAQSDGRIKDPKTLTALLDRAEKRREAASGPNGILALPATKDVMKAIEERTFDELANPLDPMALSDETLEAKRDFELSLLAWDEANPNASYLERRKAVDEIGRGILSRIDSNTKQFASDADIRAAQDAEAAAPQEDPSQEAVEQAPREDRGALGALYDLLFGQDEQPTEGDGPEPAPQAPDQADPLTQFYSGEEPPELSTLPDEWRNELIRRAAEAGEDPETYNMNLFKWAKRALGLSDQSALTPPASPASLTVPEAPSAQAQQVAATIDQAVAAPQVRRGAVGEAGAILDLLGYTEGTDPSDRRPNAAGYNETLSYGAFTGGPVDLVNMTLDEVNALQRRMLRHPDNKWNSSAVGRYQIVGTTLRRLRKQMGLSGSEKFTPELQDRMALELLRGRGYERWKAGKLSDEDFLDNLAKEWASIPTRGGRGYYGNQSRTPVTPQQVLATFGQARKGARPVPTDDVTAKGRFGNSSVPFETQYKNVPRGEWEQFRRWNPDPIGNHERNLASINPTLADVVRRAGQLSKVPFVIGSGRRDQALQDAAVEWGWSRSRQSDHLTGNAVDLWPIAEDGSVNFSRAEQLQIVAAMDAAAKELGVTLDVGARWRSFEDLPHFGLRARPQTRPKKNPAA